MKTINSVHCLLGKNAVRCMPLIKITSLHKSNVSVFSHNVLRFVLKNNFSHLYKKGMLGHVEYVFLKKYNNEVRFSNFHRLLPIILLKPLWGTAF